jgi:hypothetical protein
MPLKAGTSRKVQSSNIRELMNSFRRTGRIGTSHPASPAKAVKQAVAISYSKQRESK